MDQVFLRNYYYMEKTNLIRSVHGISCKALGGSLLRGMENIERCHLGVLCNVVPNHEFIHKLVDS